MYNTGGIQSVALVPKSPGSPSLWKICPIQLEQKIKIFLQLVMGS